MHYKFSFLSALAVAFATMAAATKLKFNIVDTPELLDHQRLARDKDYHIDSVQWNDVNSKVDRLNKDAQENEYYKLLYVVRHGYGEHNRDQDLAIAEGWLDHFKAVAGTAEKYHDAKMTPEGWQCVEEEAARVQAATGFQKPNVVYSSPLRRAWQTGMLIFPESDFVLHEDMREQLSHRTSERRSSKEKIIEDVKALKKNHPEIVGHVKYELDADKVSFTPHTKMTYSDPRWSPDYNEASSGHQERTERLLLNILTADPASPNSYKDATPIAFAGHWGTCLSLFDFFGVTENGGQEPGHPDIRHRWYWVINSQVVAMIMKVTEVPE